MDPTQNFPSTVLLVILSLALAACDSGNPDDTGAFDRPEGSREVISDEQLQHLIDIGAEVHEGDNPPDISGTYFWGDTDVRFYSGENGWPLPNTTWCHNEVTYTKTGRDTYGHSSTSPNCDLEGEGSGIFISGEGRSFTLYRMSEETFEDCEYTSVGVLSATIEEGSGDMVNVLSASTITSQSGACTVVAAGRTRENGSSSLTSTESGRSERIDDPA